MDTRVHVLHLPKGRHDIILRVGAGLMCVLPLALLDGDDRKLGEERNCVGTEGPGTVAHVYVHRNLGPRKLRHSGPRCRRSGCGGSRWRWRRWGPYVAAKSVCVFVVRFVGGVQMAVAGTVGVIDPRGAEGVVDAVSAALWAGGHMGEAAKVISRDAAGFGHVAGAVERVSNR